MLNQYEVLLRLGYGKEYLQTVQLFIPGHLISNGFIVTVHTNLILVMVLLVVVVGLVLGFTTLLTSQVISVAFYSEHEKSDKFCSEALILA